jgi:chromosome partitioning protein
MRTITVASGKGGSTKTTCTATLAVRAAKDGRVGMIDLNEDQASLTDWWINRGKADNPTLVESSGDISQDIEELREDGFAWVFIDTPPLGFKPIEAAISVADLVVIPVRASLMDISATNAVTSLCRKYRKPFVFLLAAVDSGMPRLAEQATQMLGMMTRPYGRIMPPKVHMSHRQSYVQAMGVGRTAPEIAKKAKDSVVTGEVDSIWDEVQRLAEPQKRAAE